MKSNKAITDIVEHFDSNEIYQYYSANIQIHGKAQWCNNQPGNSLTILFVKRCSNIFTIHTGQYNCLQQWAFLILSKNLLGLRCNPFRN